MAGRMDGEHYITWQDVADLIHDIEEEYGCVVHIEIRGNTKDGGRSLYHRCIISGNREGDVIPVAWRGGTQKGNQARTMPALYSQLLTGLYTDMDAQLAYRKQAQAELDL